MVVQPKVEIQLIDPEEHQSEVLALLRSSRTSLDARFADNNYWLWKHVKNPAGRSLVFAGFTSAGDIVSVRAFMRWGLTVKGEPVPAFRPLDSATRADYRRLGLFNTGTKLALEAAGREGVTLSLGNPNSLSLPGYKKLGWNVISQAHMYFNRPGITDYMTAYGRGAIRLLSLSTRFKLPKPVEELPAQPATPARIGELRAALIELSAGNETDALLRTEPSQEFLNWRYLDDPRLKHGVHVERAGGVPQFGVAYRVRTGRSGWRTVVIESYESRNGSSLPGPEVVDMLKQIERCDTVSILGLETELTDDPNGASFKPHEHVAYTVTCRSIDPVHSHYADSIKHWRLNLADFLGI